MIGRIESNRDHNEHNSHTCRQCTLLQKPHSCNLFHSPHSCCCLNLGQRIPRCTMFYCYPCKFLIDIRRRRKSYPAYRRFHSPHSCCYLWSDPRRNCHTGSGRPGRRSVHTGRHRNSFRCCKPCRKLHSSFHLYLCLCTSHRMFGRSGKRWVHSRR